MPTISLPDGSTRQYEHAVTPAQVASDIGPGLSKAAMAAVVNGTEWDLSRPINDCLLYTSDAADE